MSQNLDFLYNWFTTINIDPLFPNIMFSHNTRMTITQKLTQLSQDLIFIAKNYSV